MSTIPPIHIDIKITENLEAKGEIRQDLVIEAPYETKINQHVDEVSARIAYWGTMLAEANRQLSIRKIDHDMWLATKKQEACSKKDFKSETAKLDAVMMSNTEEYAKQIKDMIDSTYNVEVLKSILDAFKSKKDMLVSLSANVRSEQERDALIKQYNSKING